jgi:hypothetical protein
MRARRCCAAYRRQRRRRAAAAVAAAPAPVAGLVRRFGDGRLDGTPAQVGTDRAAGVGLVAQDPPWPGSGPAAAPAGDRKPGHERSEGQGIVALPGTGHPRQRPAGRVGEQVDFAGQPAAGTAQRLPVLVIRSSPAHGPGNSADRLPAGPGQYRLAAGAAPRPRAGEPARPWRPPRPSTPGLRPHQPRHAAGPGSSPRSHPRTSAGAGYRPSSSSRTAPAGPATGTPPWSGRRSHRSPAGDHSTGAPAADEQAVTASAAPTPHR